MEHAHFRCKGCRKLHRRRVQAQQYCGATKCQRSRKNAWRKDRYATDVDYRLTAKASTAAWLEMQGGAAAYHRAYRRRRQPPSANARAGKCAAPTKMEEGLAANPSFQPRSAPRANSDATFVKHPVMTGQYLLVPQGGANSDAIFVQLSVITQDFPTSQRTTDFSGTGPRATLGG
jgi:hypothetical protein